MIKRAEPSHWIEVIAIGTMTALVLVFVWLFYWKWELFYQSDLGRHLTNGRLIWETGRVPGTNLYSYTQTDWPTLMHHWGAGVTYFLIHRYFGFDGLALASSLLYLAAAGLAVVLGLNRKNWIYKLGLLILLVPIFSLRVDIRPESFSYLLIVLHLAILSKVYWREWAQKWLMVLPLLQVFWVNLHIYFIFGLLLSGYYWLASFLTKKKDKTYRAFLLATVLSLAASFINPYGYRALTGPLTIVDGVQRNRVLENMDVFSYIDLFGSKPLDHFVAVYFGFVLSVFVYWKNKKFTIFRHEMLLVLVWGLLGVFMVRNVTLFGYALLVLGWRWLVKLESTIPVKSQFRAGLVVLVWVVVGWGAVQKNHYYSPFSHDFGLKVSPGSLAAGEFLAQQAPVGPIFNNYDIGGYLIYYLYPKDQVFIDNRPEAYPSQFFLKTYVPMQYDESVWLATDAQIGFKTIIVSKKDKTEFLHRLLDRRRIDPRWQVWYEDDYVLVMKRLEN